MSKPDPKRRLALLGLWAAGLLLMAGLALWRTLAPVSKPSALVTPDPIVERLGNLISLYKNGRIGVIELAAATDFPWERVYIFAPYTPAPVVDQAVGLSWRTSCPAGIESAGDFTLLLFTTAGSVIHCLDYPPPNDFVVPWPQGRAGFSPHQALFVLDDKGRLALRAGK